jgi:hypothetical protein
VKFTPVEYARYIRSHGGHVEGCQQPAGGACRCDEIIDALDPGDQAGPAPV